MTEEWRPVVGYEGLYEVSDLGNVRSLTRTVTRYLRSGPREITFAGRTRKPNTTGFYNTISLGKDGKGRTFTIHRLVAEAFLGPRPHDRETTHLDGNARNNALTNLAYRTAKQNANDKREHGTLIAGATHYAAKLTESDAQAIRASTEQIEALAARYGITQNAVKRIRYNQTWNHLPKRPTTSPDEQRLHKSSLKRGERNHAARITEADAAAIRASKQPLKALAQTHGLAISTVSMIRSGKLWKHLNNPDERQ